MDYDMEKRVYALYGMAYEVECNSQSGRMIELHERGKGCRVYLGVTNPTKTKDVFVLYSPAGEPRTYDQENRKNATETSARGHVNNYLSMADYLQRDERLARNIKKFIEVYADRSGIRYDECVNEFGQVNISFYPSPGVQTKDLSEVDYYIETEESYVVLKEELDLKYLRSLIFSGPSFDYFFRKIYMLGARVLFDRKTTGIKEAFRTKIFNGTDVLCVFIKHLSYINDPTKVAEGFWKLLNREIQDQR